MHRRRRIHSSHAAPSHASVTLLQPKSRCTPPQDTQHGSHRQHGSCPVHALAPRCTARLKQKPLVCTFPGPCSCLDLATLMLLPGHGGAHLYDHRMGDGA
jgi:hypothetical protein